MVRRRDAANTITGPQSALTNFLAANNISAAQIRREYESRLRAAEQDGRSEVAVSNSISEEPELEEPLARRRESTEQKRKRDKKEEAEREANLKSKKARGIQRKKREYSNDAEDAEHSEDHVSWDMYAKKKPLPGQLENCETCGKRFTVTPYSKEGNEGGLLCAKCSKELMAERKKDAKAKKPAIGREKRRKAQSKLLDGILSQGAKTLQELCVEKVAENINDIDEFGDLPPALLDRLSQILSKRRVISTRTIDLFLRPDLDTVAIYDCAKLETEDFLKIFAITPRLEHLTLEHAGQFKDNVLDYIMERNVPLRSLKLEAANLVSDAKWREFFHRVGERIQTLKLTWLDSAFDDDTFRQVVDDCPNLKYLKLKKCFRIGDTSLESMSKLQNLEHLSLLFATTIKTDTLLSLIRSVGKNLRTLSLERHDNADDQVLLQIHANCTRLNKLRFTANDYCSDAGFVALFTKWSNPPLSYVNLSECRDIDHDAPDGPEDPIGLASEGFQAMMAHSGSKLEKLNIKSCRHIGHEALAHAFDGVKQYPSMKEIDVSFLKNIDTVVLAGLFKSCPAITKVTAFSCFNIKDALVPAGVALIGVPNAQDSIVQEGNFFSDLVMRTF